MLSHCATCCDSNYKISVVSDIKFICSSCSMALVDQQGSSACIRHAGDVTCGADTISNIASHQARKKRVLGGLISLLKALWSEHHLHNSPARTSHMAPPNRETIGKHKATLSQKERELGILSSSTHDQHTQSTSSFLSCTLKTGKPHTWIFSFFFSYKHPYGPGSGLWKLNGTLQWGLKKALAFLIKGIGHNHGVFHSYLTPSSYLEGEAV